MYRAFRRGSLRIVLNRFNPEAKSISRVYRTGFRKFQDSHGTSWSIVAGNWRIIVSLESQLTWF